MKIVLYTDGGCLNNGSKHAKASWAYFFPDHPELSSAERVPADQPQTNNRGELLGILNGVEKAIASFSASDVDLYVYTDSEYSKNCLTKWMPGWIKKGWMTAAGTPVLNKDLIQLISSRLMQFQSYCINHVRAHTGGDDEFSRHNHTVDRMAAAALDDAPTSPPPKVKNVMLDAIEGCPLQMMGPPVSDTTLVNWCRQNLDKLDETAVKSALLKALTTTMRKNGYDVVKQKLHRVTQYRLTALSHIVTEIHKEEE
jgi:ribonuclease HI